MKKIFLALTGSIACIKSFDLIKGFQEKGYEVQIILSKGGEKFSSRLALESMTGFPVLGPDIFAFKKTEEYLNPFQKNTSEIFAHLELSQQSEALVVAPCSANFLEKMASGRAVDFLSTAVLAYTNPIVVCPAMNTKMLENPVVNANLRSLQENKNISIIHPKISGILACKEEGAGKMADVQDIILFVGQKIYAKNFPEISEKFSQKKILINLGGTQEKLDPVRYIGNFSTGKTGKILAEKVFEMGVSSQNISIVQGNTSFFPEISEKFFDIQKISNTEEMRASMNQKFLESDVIVFAAAVADFIPERYSEQKIKKDKGVVRGSHGCPLQISIKQNIDIAKYFAQKKRPYQIFIGFALETGDEIFLKKSLQKKSQEKSFDIVIGNSPANIGTDAGDFLVYFSQTKKFQKFSGKKSETFEKILAFLFL